MEAGLKVQHIETMTLAAIMLNAAGESKNKVIMLKACKRICMRNEGEYQVTAIARKRAKG